MKTIGERIKALRCALGLTQKQLAQELEIDVKSVQRYEAGKSRPDTYTLARLAAFFDVSSDYLLGLIGYEEQVKEEAYKISRTGPYKYNSLYAHYLQCKNKPIIDSTSEYYSICLSDDLRISAQTCWAGWANSEMTVEIRRITPVNPIEYMKLCSLVFEKPMLVNTKEDADIFRIFGGQALVKVAICERYLPEFCKDFITSRW